MRTGSVDSTDRSPSGFSLQGQQNNSPLAKHTQPEKPMAPKDSHTRSSQRVPGTKNAFHIIG
jgi:hypothetical protein